MPTTFVCPPRTLVPLAFASWWFRALALALFSLGSLLAQMRPPAPGGGGNPGGGGGAGGTPGQVTIVAPRGALVGDTVTANVQLGQGGAAAGATFQWTITGGRILNDARAGVIQFIADAPGTVTLAVTVTAGAITASPTAEITVISAESAGVVTAASMVAADAVSVEASVPPGQNGDRMFRWAVSGGATILGGQGTNSITFRPGSPGLKQVTCNVNLQNLITVPVRAYVVATGTGEPTRLTVNGGSGGGVYRSGSRVDIFADPPAAGQLFDRWTGDTLVLGTAPVAATLSRTVISLPATPVTLTATYKAAPAWTPRTVANFNPQSQTIGTNPPVTVSTTLISYVPANPTGLVFLLHDSGGAATDWLERPHQLLLARELVAAGYGIAMLNSVNRTLANWTAQPLLGNNVDALNHAAAHARLINDGQLTATKPLFFLGNGTGGTAGLRYAEQLATAAPNRPVKGAILFLAPGIENLAITSRVPQLFVLAANDDELGPAGLAAARDNSEFLLGRGVATGVVTNPVAPLHPARFRHLGLTAPTFTAADAQAIWTAVKGAAILDENNYPKFVPLNAALSAALPAAYRARTADVAAEIAIAAADHTFFSDANARVLNFINNRAMDAAAPPPGRLINLSTRSSIAFLGDSLSLGFNLTGPERATLLIRGVGPALTKFGLAGALPAPRLEVNRGGTVFAANEGWDRGGGTVTAAQISAAAASVGAFSLEPGALDTSVLLSLDPGAYTVTIRGLGGATGDVLAEIYDVSRNGTRLTNLSTLARIAQEGDLLIPGIVIAGANPRTVVIRAVAQGLRDFGLPEEALLGDARIVVLEGTEMVATNNNWAQGGTALLTAAFPAVGAFPLRSASDAALVNALAPGSYTLQAGAAPLPQQPPANFVAPAQTGSVLVEVYEVP